MSVTVETPAARLPLPAHFSLAEQHFSIKKRHRPSPSPSSCPSPAHLCRSVPPLPPSKGCPPLSRMFPPQPSPFTPLSQSLSRSPTSAYDPHKQQTYFNQCFSNLGLIGRGSFGEVFKVQRLTDGKQFAVKRSAHRFRSSYERKRSLREAQNHERLGPHPHILHFVAAWEECDRLYIQTELCSSSLLLRAENQPPGPDEAAAWGYLCDLLSALHHMHSHGYVHLDLKPANVLVTESGRLKLADFGLMFEFNQKNEKQKVREDVQEGDPRYMAPELLRGVYGPAADVFSLGVSLLELACNIEVPNGGEGWQQLRHGVLPTHFTNGLSPELRTLLQMMMDPEPDKRPSVSELLSLHCVQRRRWKRHVYLTFTEAVLTLSSLCKMVFSFSWGVVLSLPWSFVSQKSPPRTPPKLSWDQELTLMAESGTEDESVFSVDPQPSPTFSQRLEFRLSAGSTSTPLSGSPSLTPDPHESSPRRSSRRRSSSSSKQRSGREDVLPRPSFEPKNLLSLFEETTFNEQPSI